MARKKTKKAKKQEVSATLAAVEAMSSDEDVDFGQEEENAEAEALRQALADGAFDHLLKQGRKDDIEEEVHMEMSADGDDEASDDEHGDVDDSESDSDDDDEEAIVPKSSSKALAAVLDEMTASKRNMPWAETFEVLSADPLPFVENPLDVHDDLKREVAFYNVALEAVKEARTKCHDAGVAFSRPEDFFAEMVKTDDHMAKVKDRLIFETKKMDAVAQRKSNKEQKLRSKEKRANKLAEKAKRKKDHLQKVDEWAKTAASNRSGGLADNDDEYDDFMQRRGGPNKKRMAADRKWGHGGKRGRFKQNDPKSLDDMSGFNPRGNFSGGTKSKKGSGANRKGKRARDAARSRR